MTLQKEILSWYEKNKRELPWRETSDAYKIWVSEVILQQTRVAQGKDYYLRFIKKFPDIKKLASADIDEVLFLWKGLGYYSRARNMHEAAKYIIRELKGEIPGDYKNLLSLKGVGQYTAAAVASIAYKEPVPVIDGNVIRVYSRLFNIEEPFDTARGKKIFQEIAGRHLDKNNPGNYNQALMEFGALHCTPRNPLCKSCIFSNECLAFKSGKVLSLPVKSKTVQIRKRYFHFLVIQYNNRVYVEKRNNKDIWHSLFQFPLIETDQIKSYHEIIESDIWRDYFQNKSIKFFGESDTIKHQLTHQTIIAKFIHIEIDTPVKHKGWISIETAHFKNLAFPVLVDQYWQKWQKKN